METADASVCLLRLYRGEVEAGWIDFNGHMRESQYLFVFAESTDALLRLIGVDAGYVARGYSFFTAETHLFHKSEAKLGDSIWSDTQVIAADPKRLHLFHRLFTSKENRLLATGEHMLLHVDLAASKVRPVLNPVAGEMARLTAAHTTLPMPSEAGRVGRRE